MNLKALLNNKIVICFHEEKNIFLNLKKNDPFLNFKIMEIKEVYERLTFIHDYKAIAEIILNKKVSLKAARQILNCLRFVDENNDFDDLLALKNDLFNKGYLVKKDYQQYLLKKSDIILFNQQNNKELQTLLNKNGISFTNILPSDLGINYDKKLVLTKYKTRFEQFNLICDQICKLLNEGVNVDDIAIRTNYNDLSFYFSIFEDLYKLKFYYKKTKNIITYNSVQNLLERMYEAKSFEIDYDLEDKYQKTVFDYIDQFKLREFDFDFAFNLLNEILDSYKETSISKTGIMVTNEFVCSTKKYVFELDFDFDNYPRVSSDDGYYIDSQIESLGMNPSYLKTQIDNDKKRLFLHYSNVILTVTNIKLSQEVFMSTYIDEFKIEVIDNIKVKMMNNSLIASKLAYKFYKNNFKNSKNAAKLDDLFSVVYSSNEEYDYKFKHFVDIENPVTRSSYSKMNSFYECPFKFYCEKILNLSKNASSQAIDLGNFTHKILEDVFKANFDFESSFEIALNSKEINLEDNTKLFFRTVVKDYVKVIVDFLIYRYKQGFYINNFAEKFVKYTVNGVEFVGFIDSILVSEMDGVKYLTVIDYKTGSTVFDPESAKDGIGLQLPMYSLFISEEKTFNTYKLGGLFIQPLFRTSEFVKDNKISEYTIREALKLQGAWETDPDYLNSVDKTLNSVKAIKSSFFAGKASPVEDVVSIKDNALEKMTEFTEKTKNFEYNILPFKYQKSKEIDGCKYCDYQHICYKNGFDYRIVRKKGSKNEVE